MVEISASFTIGLKDIEVTENSSFTLEVELSHPKADVTWLMDDVELEQNEKYEFVVNDLQRQLLVSDVTLEDEGEYTCLVGDDETSAYVVVNGK